MDQSSWIEEPPRRDVAASNAEEERLTTPCPLIDGVTREYLLHHGVCPSTVTASGALVVAVGSNAYREALDELAVAYARPVIARDVNDGELGRMIERLAARANGESDWDAEPAEAQANDREIANQPPVVRYVNVLLREAYEAGASDIHIEATRGGATARMRMDGVLVPGLDPPRGLQDAVVSRIKLLADLDIAERRRPQDGRIRARVENADLHLRVSTAPTVHGESVVLRLLDRGSRPVDLDSLGMPAPILEQVSQAIAKPHGMILVTGPTGSGKTTTLYSALCRRDAQAEKIITVEDPVEFQLDGIAQVPVHRQAGVTFASALRAILRQDPDVVMVGEMRDGETAEVGTQAAMTGHLVFATLHTNDAISALPRLFDLGIPPFLVAATVTTIIAQRLVRIACSECKTTEHRFPARFEHVRGQCVDTDATYVQVHGCAACRHTGYSGRVGIFEVVTMDDALRSAIADRAPAERLRVLGSARGYRPMLADGLAKAAAGITTVEEVMRVAHV